MRRPRRGGLSDRSLNRMVPNVLTLLALCAGMTAIRFAMNGNFIGAVFAIIVAGVFDGLDGRIARLLKSTSSFGAELDSLSDFVSFGVAPAAVLYLWTMSGLGGFGWAVVLFFAVCCALRLARFNTQTGVELPPYAAPFFCGVPAPAGAGLVIVPLFMSFQWGDWPFRSPYLSAVVMTATALAMVSRLPTVSLKGLRVPQQYVLPTLLGLGIATALFTTVPWPTLTAVGIVYLASIPLTVRAYLQLRRQHLARLPEAAAEPVSPPAIPVAAMLDEPRLPQSEWRH